MELSAIANTVIKMPSKSNVKVNSRTTPAKKETQHPPGQNMVPAPSKKVVYYCKDHS
jgi:hypothetical protein